MKVSRDYLANLLNLRGFYPEKGNAQFVDGMSLELESDHVKIRIVLDDDTLSVNAVSRDTGNPLLRLNAAGDFGSPKGDITIIGAEIGDDDFIENVQSVFTVLATYIPRLRPALPKIPSSSIAEVTP